tara:strand:+ start:179 stop:406 length:228 start_codon:yes stop_codon:yes gene_type:complete
MLNRLLMAVHWALSLWILIVPMMFVTNLVGLHRLIDKVNWTGLVFAGAGAYVIYMIALRIIKSRWIWFPWQHDKD